MPRKGQFKYTISDCNQYAKAKGGHCLSKAYNPGYLNWECANGHRWKALASTVRRSWCPYCADGSHEECVRICFQRLFRRKFPKAWPDWLKTGNKRPLELDGYNKRLGIAFEHQGRHHYQYVRHFHRNSQRLNALASRDRKKARLCRKVGVSLIRIPEVGWRFSLNDLLQEVIKRCRRAGIRIPNGSEGMRISYAPAWNLKKEKANSYLRALRLYAKHRGGALLDSAWQGLLWKYRLRCRSGHRFNAVYSSLVRLRTWCPQCGAGKIGKQTRLWWAGNRGKIWRRKIRKQNGIKWLSKIHAYATKRGGKCLTTEWNGWKGKCLFRCGKCGKSWSAQPFHILKEHAWCRTCAIKKMHQRQRKKYDYLRDIQDFARKNGGRCLARSWQGYHHKYPCVCGHCGRRWLSRGSTILSGSWCKPCATREWLAKKRAQKNYLKQLQFFAKSKGGSCLAKKWEGWSKKYRFRCKCGREWEAVGGNVLHLKNWCKPCSRREAWKKRKLGLVNFQAKFKK